MRVCFAMVAFFLASAFFEPHRLTLFNSLDPTSIREHFAFYELYPESPEGQKALAYAWKLMNNDLHEETDPFLDLPLESINSLLSLITQGENSKILILKDHELELIQKAGSNLANRKLRGYDAKTEKEVIALPFNQIDLAKGLFLAKMEENSNLTKEEALSYEALIDLMALQILAKLPENATTSQKVRAINHFIFEEMGFRFPPHSLYAKDVDLYTFLPAVLDSREGVCLGVSVLYLCLAQRLNLPIETVTPPGHIYVRCRENDKILNIETTARGIHIECEEYLGIDTPYLQIRNIKEVIGLSYINEASVYLQKQQFDKALKCYEKAESYLPNDALLKDLMGYTHLFLGHIDEGKILLKEALKMPDSKLFHQENMALDFLDGKVDVEGIKTIFLPVDETRESIAKKKEEIEGVIKKFPEFSAGYFNLAITFLQLNRMGEALEALEQYQKRKNDDAKAEYFLAALYTTRLNYPKAWNHLHQLEKLLSKREKKPKPLLELKQELRSHSPE